MQLWQDIANHISSTLGEEVVFQCQQSAGGGCINQTFIAESTAGRSYFVKLNSADGLEMFAAEAEGLNEIVRSHTIKAPRPICWGLSGTHAYIVMERLELGGGGSNSIAALGEQLAAMHRTTQARFGWFRDNTIGATLQVNTPHANWLEFWREQRLRFQLDLAARKGYRGALQRDGAALLDVLAQFFPSHSPSASLLHGDLWSGNYAITRLGEPVIFDPATYYGDREADLAMTELFGGFPATFYSAYNASWALESGYKTRKTLYNLYHIINHLNLFGGSYQGQAERMIKQLLSEVRG